MSVMYICFCDVINVPIHTGCALSFGCILPSLHTALSIEQRPTVFPNRYLRRIPEIYSYLPFCSVQNSVLQVQSPPASAIDDVPCFAPSRFLHSILIGPQNRPPLLRQWWCSVVCQLGTEHDGLFRKIKTRFREAKRAVGICTWIRFFTSPECVNVVRCSYMCTDMVRRETKIND